MRDEDAGVVIARSVVEVVGVVVGKVEMERSGPLLLMKGGLLLLMKAGTLLMKVWLLRKTGMQQVKAGIVSQPLDELLRNVLQALKLAIVEEGVKAILMDLQAGREHFLEGDLPAMRAHQLVSLLEGAHLHSPEGLIQPL